MTSEILAGFSFSIYSIPNIFGAFALFAVGIIVIVHNGKSLTNRAFFSLAILVAIWLGSYAITYSTTSTSVAYFYCRVACTSVMYMTPILYLFFSSFLNKYYQERFFIALSFLIMTIMFPFFVFTPYFLDEPIKYNWGYYSKAGPFHPVYLVVWVSIWTKGLVSLFLNKNMWSNIEPFQKRLNFIYLGLYFMPTLGIIDYIPKYGVDFYPLGWAIIALFSFIVAYAIVQYRFMDISLVVTRFSVFVGVYSIILGVPFIISLAWESNLVNMLGESWWVVPLFSSTILAILGPYIYLYLKNKAEERVMIEQRQYQDTLRRAAIGMGRIKDLKRLVNLIVHIVSRTVRISNTKLYLLDEEKNSFELAAFKFDRKNKISDNQVFLDSNLIKYLNSKSEPIVYQEIKQMHINKGIESMGKIANEMYVIDAEILVPCILEGKIKAVIALGSKKKGKLYSEDDLVVFSILASQAAIAIENAIFYEDMRLKHEQLFKAEKMATIGTMADGLSHQINNRLHSMGFIAGNTIDSISFAKTNSGSSEEEKFVSEIQHALERIQNNVVQGGEIVRGLLRYSRKGAEGFMPVDLNELIDTSFEMVQYKIKSSEFDFNKNINSDLPKLFGNFTQLQEVFFNLFDNAYDAMMQRKQEVEEENYAAEIKVSARRIDKSVEILVCDNGIGVKEEDKAKLFTPFFTTKISSKKGTGLGLYVIKQIVEENHSGFVSFNSEYLKGSKTNIILPISD